MDQLAPCSEEISRKRPGGAGGRSLSGGTAPFEWAQASRARRWLRHTTSGRSREKKCDLKNERGVEVHWYLSFLEQFPVLEAPLEGPDSLFLVSMSLRVPGSLGVLIVSYSGHSWSFCFDS